MGLVIKADLETSKGQTEELFIRIDNWKVNLTTNEIRFTTTSWLNKEYGDNFRRKYFEESLKPAVGLVTSKVIYYKDLSSEGDEIEIPNLYHVPMWEEKEIEEDVIENKEVAKEVPYVSFDENGDEVTLYRTVKAIEKVKTGTNKVTRKVIDYSSPLNKLGELSYNHLIKELKKLLPGAIIEKV